MCGDVPPVPFLIYWICSLLTLFFLMLSFSKAMFYGPSMDAQFSQIISSMQDSLKSDVDAVLVAHSYIKSYTETLLREKNTKMRINLLLQSCS